MHIFVTGLLNLLVGVLGRERLDQLLFSRGQHTLETDHQQKTIEELTTKLEQEKEE